MEIYINGTPVGDINLKMKHISDNIDIMQSEPQFISRPGGTFWNDDQMRLTDSLENLENMDTF